jgi:hypothetical protein
MKKSTKRAIFLVGVAIGVIVVGSVAIYLARKDAEFIRWEDQPDYKGPCTGPATWLPADLPVDVYLLAEDRELEPDVKEAIALWAPYLNWKGLVPQGMTAKGTIVHVSSMPLREIDPHGDTRLRHDKSCKVKRAEVRIPMPLLKNKVRACVVKHELGHALGIGHSDDEDSVMSPTRGVMFRCDRSDHLVALLRTAYGTL